MHVTLSDRSVLHAQGRGTAWSVWDGAVALAKYLESSRHTVPNTSTSTELIDQACKVTQIKPSRILELGSGTGLAGLAAAAVFRVPVILTDLPEALPALHRNVQANQGLASLVTVTACDWNRPQDWENGIINENKPFDLILVADCVWVDHLVEPLVHSLRLLATPEETIILLSHQPRSARVDDKLFALLEEWFSIKEIEETQDTDRGPIRIFWLTVQGKETT